MLAVAGAAGVVLLADAVIRGGWWDAALLSPWVALGVWAAYVGLYASAVTTDDAGILIQNLLRRIRVPWSAVADIRLRYQLVVVTADGARISCYGGPAAGPASAALRRRGGGEGRALRATAAIRDAWRTAPARSDAVIRRSWDRPALIALAAIAAAAAVAVLVAGR